jgi:selenocysteine lyase/cysteine desulfurase
VAIGAASNALGTVNDVREAARLAHAHGALCFVDGVHYAAHRAIDVRAMDCDFFVCSPYKFYGPHTGVLLRESERHGGARRREARARAEPDSRADGDGHAESRGHRRRGAAVDFLASMASGRSRREKLTRALVNCTSRAKRSSRSCGQD